MNTTMTSTLGGAGMGRMWATGLGGAFLALGGWLALSSGGDGATLGALIWLGGVALILWTASDLAIYKGRRRALWIVLSLLFGWIPVVILALLPNLRLGPGGIQPGRLSTSTMAGELAHLSALHTAGILSEEEFAQAKQRLLTS